MDVSLPLLLSLPALTGISLQPPRVGVEGLSGPKAEELELLSLSVAEDIFPQTSLVKVEGFCKFVMSLRNLFNQLPFPGGALHLMRDMMEGIKIGLREFSFKPPSWCITEHAVI